MNSRHHQIEEHNVGMGPSEYFQAFDGAERGENFQAISRERILDQLQTLGLVVNRQEPRNLLLGHARNPSRSDLRSLVFSPWSQSTATVRLASLLVARFSRCAEVRKLLRVAALTL